MDWKGKLGWVLVPCPLCISCDLLGWRLQPRAPSTGLPSSRVSSSVGFFPFPSLKTHKQNPKLLWPKCVTYGAISESALGTKLVLHCHFCDNEGEESRESNWQANGGDSVWGLPRRQRLWGWAQHPDSGSRLKKDTCKTSFAEKTAFLLGNLAICNQSLKNVWNHCSSNFTPRNWL